MKSSEALLVTMVTLAIGIIPIDIFFTSRFVQRFKEIESQRIVTSNQLATAKIVSENLDHVRDLVYRNMAFTGHIDSVSQETILFEFLTSCVNDLKMKLVSVNPSRPTNAGRVTTYGYEIQLEGDFFSFGEFCSKLENSQRLLAITSFSVTQNTGETSIASAAIGGKGPIKIAPTKRRGITVSLHLDTFRVKKNS
jgi:hypothetical protein